MRKPPLHGRMCSTRPRAKKGCRWPSKLPRFERAERSPRQLFPPRESPERSKERLWFVLFHPRLCELSRLRSKLRDGALRELSRLRSKLRDGALRELSRLRSKLRDGAIRESSRLRCGREEL